MLTSLRIKNFKAWVDTGEIHMSPITLFFGGNSSGKSSIGQLIMLLKQTVESQDRKIVLYPGEKNSPVQLGSYFDMVHDRNKDNKIEFEYKWRLPNLFRLRNEEKTFSADEMLFSGEIGIIDSTNVVGVYRLDYSLFQDDIKQFQIGMARTPNNKYKISSGSIRLVRTQARPWEIGSPARFYGFPDEVVAYHQNADFVQELNLLHERLFRNIHYLGPLRDRAERMYSWYGIEPENVGTSGQYVISALLAAASRKMSLGKKLRKKAFQELIAQQLQKLGLIKEFNINKISESRQDYEVKVKTNGQAQQVDLPDVGFGVSQVLPVVVQSFYAADQSIMIMEQPELHLHPIAQSNLADMFIDALKSRQFGHSRDIQFIIETHSEHFLRRLQRRIAEGAISESMVSAYFVSANKNSAQINNLNIDTYGNISNWPDNFFGDEITDISLQAKAALNKRINKF